MTTDQPRSCLAPRLAVFLLVAFLGACAGMAATSSQPMNERIRNATTRAEHSSLAEFYDKEIQVARQKAGEHRQMHEAYRGRAGVGRGGVELQSSILRHCATLVEQYERAAVEYEALAALHRRLAGEAPR